MITRKFPDILSTFRGLTEELAYSRDITPLRWGVCAGFSSIITVEIKDALQDDNLHLGMSSFTKSRWTRFLRRYFRPGFQEWVDESMAKLQKYPNRPFVVSYAPNLDTGHNYGGCLSSVQFRINPTPQVILYSRACQIDKIGFLDLCLIHVLAKKMSMKEVSATWVISNAFISAISQIYYLQRFNMPHKGHRLERAMKRLTDVEYESIKFGPLKRGRKRMMALKEFGEIPRSIAVKHLELNP